MTVEAYLGLVTLRTGRPAKMVWSRHESLLARPKRHPFVMRYRSAATRDGPSGRPRHRPALRLRRVRLPLGAGADVRLGLRRRAVRRAERARARPHRVHQQPAHQRLPRLRRHAGHLRLRVADRPARARAPPRPAGVARAQLPGQGRHPAGRADAGDGGRGWRRAWSVPGRRWASRARRRDRASASDEELACNIQPYGRIIWLNDWSSAWVGFELDGTLRIRIGVPDVGGGQASSLCQIASRSARRAAGAHHHPHRRQRPDPADRHDDRHPPTAHVRQRRPESQRTTAREHPRSRGDAARLPARRTGAA